MESDDRLLHHLDRAGPTRAGDLQRALGLSEATFRRAVRRLGDALLVTGRARATTCARRRALPGLIAPVPVYEVDPGGDARHALTLHPVEPWGVWVETHVSDVEAGFFETDPRAGADSDLPWFLDELRPAGFLGRAWLAAHPDHGFPADLGRWTGDDALRFAAHHDADAPGAWLVGPAARDRWLSEDRWAGAPSIEALRATLPALAEQVLRGRAAGSSPGGEQPKLTARALDCGRPVSLLVKFSPPLDTPGGRRWGDLLVAEHLAHGVLRGAGFEAPASSLHDGGGRRFLLVERFDRHGTVGRSGLVSLFPFDHAGVASDLHRWSLLTDGLVRQGRLTAEDHERVRWLEAFGHLIANTDLHPGNLSFRLRGARITGLAPIYDMVPMAHAPRFGGEVRSEVYDASAELADAPADARRAAAALWCEVVDHAAVSDRYRALACRQADLADTTRS